jgi:hypothetical protein
VFERIESEWWGSLEEDRPAGVYDD